jgi:hypothetical protein
MQIDTSSIPDDVRLLKFAKVPSEKYYHKSEGYLRNDEEGNYVDITEQAQLNNLA